MQIDLTWNLFLTAVLVPGCFFALKVSLHNMEKRRLDREEKLADALAETERLKEAAIQEWRKHYTTALDNGSSTMCSIKRTVDEIKTSLHDKVDWQHCKHEMERFEDRMKAVKELRL